MLFEPTSGGRFNADLAGAELKIHHNIAIKSTLQRDSSGNLEDPNIDNNDVVNFERDLTAAIKAEWENKFQFVRGTVKVRPKFTQSFIPISDKTNAKSCHYVISITGGPPGSAAVTNKTYHEFKNEVAQPGGVIARSANFPVTVNKPAASAQLVSAALPKYFPYYADTFNGAFSPATASQLKDLAKQVADANAATKIYLTPYGNLTQASYNAVASILTAAGLTNLHRRRSRRIFSTSTSKSSGRTNYVKLTLSEPMPNPVFAHSNLYNYPATIVHEFGHMLGLKDEYNCLSAAAANSMVNLQFIEQDEKIAYEARKMPGAVEAPAYAHQEQAGFMQYCKDAGVMPPTFGQHTASIMSAGAIFSPCHFVTMWAALNQLSPGTGTNVWKIEPHG